MKYKNPALLLAIVFATTFVCSQIYADQEPAEYPSTASPATSGACPGLGSCSQTVTPGSYYCDSCWFWGCGCQCATADDMLNVAHQVGDCSLQSVTVTKGGVTVTTQVASCSTGKLRIIQVQLELPAGLQPAAEKRRSITS
jgi:hypothetical protein